MAHVVRGYNRTRDYVYWEMKVPSNHWSALVALEPEAPDDVWSAPYCVPIFDGYQGIMFRSSRFRLSLK